MTQYPKYDFFSFCYFLLKYESRITDKEQKMYTNLFYIYVLKELSPKTISQIFNKGELWRRSGKLKQVEAWNTQNNVNE